MTSPPSVPQVGQPLELLAVPERPRRRQHRVPEGDPPSLDRQIDLAHAGQAAGAGGGASLDVEHVGGVEHRPVAADVAVRARARRDRAAEADADPAGHLLLQRDEAGDLEVARHPGDRPQHPVRAAAHHPDRPFPLLISMMAEARLERARDQALVADLAALGGEEEREAHRLHLAQQDEIGRAATAVDHFRSVNLTARRRQRPLHVHRRQPDPARDQEVDRVAPRFGEAGPERTQNVDLGAGKRALEQRRAPSHRFGQNLGSTAGPDRHQGERAGQQRVAPPSASNHYELSGLGGGQRFAAREPKNEVTTSKSPVFRDFCLEVAHGPVGRLSTANRL